MPTSSEYVLDHIADYLKFISSAQSFWFTLNTSYDHGCHLADRLRLEPNEYEVLLVVAGLASYTRFGFAIMRTAWTKFLGGHRFATHNCAIEFDKKKIDLDACIDGTPPSRLQRREFYVVRIGNKTEPSLNRIEDQTGRDGRLITTPPRLNGIGIKSQSFRRLAEPYIWNFIIENNDKDDIVENDKEDGDGVAAVAAAAAAAASTTTAAASTTTALLHPPVPANKKRKLENGVSNEYVSSNYSSYPNLSSALGQEDGFDPTDSSVQKKMRALLAELINLLSDDYELNIIDSANNSVSYVRVPKTSSD
jgi:hypothetical protein